MLWPSQWQTTASGSRLELATEMLLEKLALAEVKMRAEIIPASGELVEYGLIVLKAIMGTH